MTVNLMLYMVYRLDVVSKMLLKKNLPIADGLWYDVTNMNGRMNMVIGLNRHRGIVVSTLSKILEQISHLKLSNFLFNSYDKLYFGKSLFQASFFSKDFIRL